MVQRSTVTGGGSRAPIVPVNLLSSKFAILPPKLQRQEEGNKSDSEVLLVRFLPGRRVTKYKEDGVTPKAIGETPQLDPDILADDAVDQSYPSDMFLGDWVYVAPLVWINHWNANQKRVEFSYFSGIAVSDQAGGPVTEVKSPAAEASWKWWNALAGYRARKAELFKELGGGSTKAVYRVLAGEYDMTSIRPVENVTPAFDCYYVQCVPVSLGDEDLDYTEIGPVLLPLHAKAAVQELLKKFTGRVNSKKPLSVENSGIGADVISLATGSLLSLQRTSTVYRLEMKRAMPLNRELFMLKHIVPWDKVFDKLKPSDFIEPLIKVTSPAAVAWALTGTEFENLIPEQYLAAAAQFNADPTNPEPKAETEESPPEKSRPASSVTPRVATEAKPPSQEPAVDAEYPDTFEEGDDDIPFERGASEDVNAEETSSATDEENASSLDAIKPPGSPKTPLERNPVGTKVADENFQKNLDRINGTAAE